MYVSISTLGLRRRWERAWTKMLAHKAARAARHTKGHDQRLPQWFIWPWARHSALQHDSYQWVSAILIIIR